MNEKFKNKYRTTSTRLQHWDYRWDGYYFITICTKNKEEYFGEIIDGKMILSPLGIIADILWCEIKNHSKNMQLDAFVVMPNHIHRIIILSDNIVGTETKSTTEVTRRVEDETRHALSLREQQQYSTIGQQRFQNQGKNSISSIIGSYKSAVSRHAHRLGFDFEWQNKFYDNIIRDDQSYREIIDYVENNPQKWEDDRFFKGSK